MNKILWSALWKIFSDNALLFNSRTVGELHSVGRRINASKPWLDEEGWEWDLLTLWCVEISKKCGRLPQEVENMMILGKTTQYTQKYFLRWSPKTEVKPVEKKDERLRSTWALKVSNLRAGENAKRKTKERVVPYPKHSHLEDLDVGVSLVSLNDGGLVAREEMHQMTVEEARILASIITEMADKSETMRPSRKQPDPSGRVNIPRSTEP